MAQRKGQIGEIVEVVNRTSKPLICTFDGRQYDLIPGYVVAEDGTVMGAGPGNTVAVNHMDYLKGEMAKRQNVLMGSEDPEDPRSVIHLVALPGDGDDFSYIEQNRKAVERFNRELFGDPTARVVVLRRDSDRPRGRGAVAVPPTNFQDGLVTTDR